MTDSTTYFLQAYYMMGGLSCQCADCIENSVQTNQLSLQNFTKSWMFSTKLTNATSKRNAKYALNYNISVANLTKTVCQIE